MTTTMVITKARRLVQDTESPYHWSDERIKSDIQMAIRMLHKVRPETRYVNGALTDGVILPAADGATVDIEDRYEDCLVYYVAHLVYSDDCTDPVSKALSDDFLAKFNAMAQM